jgi:hypothetical protein
MNAASTDETPVRRSWKTFNLKTLLLLVLCVGCLFGGYAALRSGVEAERHALAEIDRLGGMFGSRRAAYPVPSRTGQIHSARRGFVICWEMRFMRTAFP